MSLGRSTGSVLLLVLALACPTSVTGEEGAPARGKVYALLIGCTEYPALEARMDPMEYEAIRLYGCGNDVENMAEALRTSLGAKPEDIRILRDWPEEASNRPTRANIVQGLEALGERAYRKEDLVVVHYAGHGDRVPDDEAGEELDGLDEVLCPADVDTDPDTIWTNTIRDDELGRLLRRIRDRGARVWLIMDCCHSATGMRYAGARPVRTRRLDPSRFGLEAKPARTRGRGSIERGSMEGARDDLSGIVAFYAAQSHQPVPEIWLPDYFSEDAQAYGLLSTTVVRALERMQGVQTFEDLFAQVVAGYRDLGKQDVVQPDRDGDLTRTVRGTGSFGGPSLRIRRTAAGLELNRGAVSGMSPASELDVYPLGRSGAEEKRLGRVVVEKVLPTYSLCRPPEDASWIDGDESVWAAKIAQVVVGDSALRLATVRTDGTSYPGPLPRALRDWLAEPEIAARFPLVSDAGRARWTVVVDDDGRPTRLEPGEASPGARRFAVADDTLEPTLRRIYRAENLLRLVGTDAAVSLPSHIQLRCEHVLPDGTTSALRVGEVASPGDRIRVFLDIVPPRHPSADRPPACDVYVFWIDPDYWIWQMFPERGTSPRLTAEAAGSKLLMDTILSDETQGEENLLVFAMPQRNDAPPLDLGFLVEEPLQALRHGTKSAEPPIARALRGLAFGSRTRSGSSFAASGDSLSLASVSWRTRWGALAALQAVDGPSVPSEAAPLASSGTSLPDPWALGSRVRMAPAGPKHAWCLLVAEEPGVRHVLVDVDGIHTRPTTEALAAIVRDHAFDWEIALRQDAQGGTAWYDQDDDGVWDLVLTDTDGDGLADVRQERRAETWQRDEGVEIPWLSTGYLSSLEDAASREEALARLRAVISR